MKDGSDITFDKFLEQMNCSYDDYVLAVRSSLTSTKLFLKRTLSEIRVNPYMRHLVDTWKANHDIQFVLDPYACVMYITEYIMKGTKGMSNLMHQATKEAREGNQTLRKQVTSVGNKFLNAVETSAQEAAYTVLQIPICKKSRQVIFINTCNPEDRARMLKTDDEIEALEDNDTEIFQKNSISRYSERPKSLKSWCLADYVSHLEYKAPKGESKSKHDPFSDNLDDDYARNSEDTDNEIETLEIGDKIKIHLKNGGQIRSRRQPKIIRYVRYSKLNDPENYFREQLMLFNPWKKESELKGNSETYSEEYHKHEVEIKKFSSKYDKNSFEIDTAIEKVNQEQSEKNDEDSDNDVMAAMAPGQAQNEADDEEEGVSVSIEFAPFDISRPEAQESLDIGHEIGAGTNVRDQMISGLIPNDDFYKLVRMLNFKQKEIFLHIYHWVTTKEEPLNIFITGGAGTGKSVLVRAIDQALLRFYKSQIDANLDAIHVLKLAMTGSAAHNIKGETMHHGLALPVQQPFMKLAGEKANSYYNKYQHLQTVIIDEISLVPSQFLSYTNTRLQEFLHSNRLFAAKHMIYVGDLFQLRPVSGDWVFLPSKKDYGPLAQNLWKDNVYMYELTEIMRQKDDKEYAELLNRLREHDPSPKGNQKLTSNDFKKIESRILKEKNPKHPSYPYDKPHTYATNLEVDTYNSHVYDRSETEKIEVKAVDVVVGDLSNSLKQKVMDIFRNSEKYDIRNNTGQLETSLQLSIGLDYDISTNESQDDGLVNGATGILRKIEYDHKKRPGLLWVEFYDKEVGQIKRSKYKRQNNLINNSWTPINPLSRTFKCHTAYISRIQFPLCLAAARTIDKTQGKTLKELVVKMGDRVKAHSHYTALSRVTSLQNLYIIDFKKDKMKLDQKVVAEMARLRTQAQVNLCYTPVAQMSSIKTRIIFQNIQSLHYHFPDIKCDQNFKPANIICLAETKLTSNDASSDYAIPGFQEILRNDQIIRTKSRPPHGLAIYVDEFTEKQHIHNYSTNDFEFILIRLFPCNRRPIVQLGLVYKRPNCRKKQLLDGLKKLKNMTRSFEQLIVVGDFNTEAFNEDRSKTATIIDIEKILDCQLVPSEYTTNANTTIDLLFASHPSSGVNIIPSVISHHKIIAYEH